MRFLQWWFRATREPAPWRVMIYMNVFTIIIGFGTMLTAESRWLACAGASIMGSGISGVIFNRAMRKMREAFNGMKSAFDQMERLNEALIAGRVEIMITKGQRVARVGDGDDDTPLSPKLH